MLIAERALAMAARFQPELTQEDGASWAQKTIEASPKTKTGTILSTPVPEPAIKEDDADGVAA